MTEEEQRLAEEAAAAEAEAAAKAEEEAKAAEEALLQEQEIDYKTLAEAEKLRADAAEALIIKNKNITKRQEGKEGEQAGLTEERVLELINAAKSTDESPEAKALAEAQKNLKIIQAKNAEIARALQNKTTPQRDVAGTQRDGEATIEPKLPEGSPLKSYKHEGNGIYSKKLASGKTLKINTKAGVGEQKKWIE